jgi:anti-sigma factor RsiW
MRATDCREIHARELLQLYVDGEIGESESVRVAAHLEGCRACERDVRAFLVLKQALRRQHVADPEAVARLCSFAALLTRGCR